MSVASKKKGANAIFESITILEELDLLYKKLEIHISNISKRNKNAPKGSLRIINKWNKHQYYHRINPSDPQGKYIPRKDQITAIRLAQKDYDNKALKALLTQQQAIGQFLAKFDPELVNHVYENLCDARKELVTPVYLDDKRFIEEWQNVTYTRLGFKDTDPEYYTAKGERVRSKSEILIADSLFRHGVPYLCEYPVYDNGVIFAAPDFKCLNVRLRKEYYWEHLGKLGDQDYVNRNANKFEKYTLSKDFDESSLILTFETETHPLNTKVIEEKICRYLL